MLRNTRRTARPAPVHAVYHPSATPIATYFGLRSQRGLRGCLVQCVPATPTSLAGPRLRPRLREQQASRDAPLQPLEWCDQRVFSAPSHPRTLAPSHPHTLTRSPPHHHTLTFPHPHTPTTSHSHTLIPFQYALVQAYRNGELAGEWGWGGLPWQQRCSQTGRPCHSRAWSPRLCKPIAWVSCNENPVSAGSHPSRPVRASRCTPRSSCAPARTLEDPREGAHCPGNIHPRRAPLNRVWGGCEVQHANRNTDRADPSELDPPTRKVLVRLAGCAKAVRAHACK